MTSRLPVLRPLLWDGQAAAALRTGAFRVAVSACTACLEEEPHNLKARARRAEARKELGEVEEARADLDFILRLSDEQLSPAERERLLVAHRLARRELGELSALLQQEKKAAQKMMGGNEWGRGRERESSGERAEQQASRTTSTAVESPAAAAAALRARSGSRQTLVDEETALKMQEDLRALYESEPVTVQLMQLRRAAEYEEVRFIQRLRPFLIKAVAPVLARHGLGEGEQGYRQMEKAIAQHVTTSDRVKANAKHILGVLMGDLADA